MGFWKKFIDVKSLITTLTVIIGALGAAYSQIDEISASISAKFYANVTAPAYLIIEYDLLKQLEKLQYDESDIKRQDVTKFTEFCDGYFLSVYVESRPSIIQRDISVACETIINIYKESQKL